MAQPERLSARSRRLAALTVLVVSCGALIATSPVQVQSTLTASHPAATELSADAPRASGRLKLTLSAEALPAIETPLRRLVGEVRFELTSRVDENVVLTARTIGQEAVSYGEYSAVVFPIEQLCRVAEPCEREFEVTLDWLAPPPEGTGHASFTAVLEIVYDRVESNPAGATAGWTETLALAAGPPGPSLVATTDPEQVILDRDRWAAARHVVLAASAPARAGHVVAVLTRRVTQVAEASVQITIVPDERDDEAPPLGTAFDPFAGCDPTAECQRGFTILFELAELDADAPAVVHWSLEARASFSETVGVPPGAELTAITDRATDVGADSPAISATASGSFRSLPAASATPGAAGAAAAAAGGASVTLTIRANPASLPSGPFGGLRPPAIGVLSVRAAGQVTIEFRVEGDGDVADASAARQLTADDLETSVLLHPLRSCALNRWCTTVVTISATTANPARADDSSVAVEWRLDLTLPYPGLDAVPAGADLEILVDADDA